MRWRGEEGGREGGNRRGKSAAAASGVCDKAAGIKQTAATVHGKQCCSVAERVQGKKITLPPNTHASCSFLTKLTDDSRVKRFVGGWPEVAASLPVCAAAQLLALHPAPFRLAVVMMP